MKKRENFDWYRKLGRGAWLTSGEFGDLIFMLINRQMACWSFCVNGRENSKFNFLVSRKLKLLSLKSRSYLTPQRVLINRFICRVPEICFCFRCEVEKNGTSFWLTNCFFVENDWFYSLSGCFKFFHKYRNMMCNNFSELFIFFIESFWLFLI